MLEILCSSLNSLLIVPSLFYQMQLTCIWIVEWMKKNAPPCACINQMSGIRADFNDRSVLTQERLGGTCLMDLKWPAREL